MKVVLSIIADVFARHRRRKVTNQLNVVYDIEESRLDARLRRLQQRSLADATW